MLKTIRRDILSFFASPCRFSLAWVPCAACATGFVLHITLFYPGCLGADEHSQLYQLKEGIIGDWHPPVMAASWKFCRILGRLLTGKPSDGNGVLYVFWTFFLWSGLFLILRSGKDFWRNEGASRKSRGVVFAVLTLLLWSTVDLFDELRNVSKDTGMVAAYLFAVGCLFNVPSRGKFRWLPVCTAPLFLFYGTAIRYNAVLTVFPLLCLAVWTVLPSKRIVVILPSAFVIWGIMLVGIGFMNDRLIGAVRLYPLQERFYDDIFHLNARTERFVLPPNSFGNDFSKLDETTFRKYFDPNTLYITSSFREVNRHLAGPPFYFEQSVVLIRPHGDDVDFSNKIEEVPRIDRGGIMRLRLLDEAVVREQFPKDYAVLKRAWIDRVLQAPFTYFKFKTVFFVKFCKKSSLYFLGLNPLLLLPLLVFFVVPYTLSDRLSDASVFPGVMLAWSALLYILPLWLIMPDDSLRYLLWFFAASIISLVHVADHAIFRPQNPVR